MNVNPHPEWKRLYHLLKDRVSPGVQFSYEELEELAGIDIQSTKGRQQFFRFRNELLKTHSLYFECIRGQGYRVVLPCEHARCANGQLSRARRRVRAGLNISYNTRLEDLTDEQRRANADVLSRLGSLQQMIQKQGRQINKLVAVVERKRLPSPAMDAASDDSPIKSTPMELEGSPAN